MENEVVYNLRRGEREGEKEGGKGEREREEKDERWVWGEYEEMSMNLIRFRAWITGFF